MLSGERPQFCKSCYDVEDASGISIRQYYLKKYSEVAKRVIKSDNVDHTEKIKFMDFSLSNNCNLKCRMCTPGASYLLTEDFDKLGMSYDKEYSTNAHKLWRYEGVIEHLISNEGEALTDILFTGGEPLTNQIHLKILLDLIESNRAPEINLTYHTNLMVLPDQIIENWGKFKSVSVHLSLEGHEKFNDYIRYKSNWNKIIKNLEKLLSVKDEIRLWLEIHTVFQAYNVVIIPEYLKYLQRYNSLFPCFPHFIWIDNPSFLSANSLTIDIKRNAILAIRDYLKEYSEFYKNSKFEEFNQEKIQILQSCLNRIDMADNEIEKNEFKDFTLKFDTLRMQNVLDVIPQLKGVFS